MRPVAAAVAALSSPRGTLRSSGSLGRGTNTWHWLGFWPRTLRSSSCRRKRCSPKPAGPLCSRAPGRRSSTTPWCVPPPVSTPSLPGILIKRLQVLRRLGKLVFDATKLMDASGWFECRDFMLASAKTAVLMPILNSLKSSFSGRGPEIRVRCSSHSSSCLLLLTPLRDSSS